MPLLTSQPSRFLGNRSRWYRAGGAPAPVAAYQPKGAADLAASYINLANPGTNNAAPGTAPTFDATTGWTFAAASNQYLTTGITPNASTWTYAIRFSNIANRASIFGAQGSSYVFVYLHETSGIQYANYATTTYVAPALTGGVLIIADRKCYRNGTEDATLAAASGNVTQPIYIGARSNGTGTAIEFASVKVQSFAIWNTTLTAGQVAAITTAMAAL